MRKSVFVYCTLLILSAMSCSSEDSENVEEEKTSPAVGVWAMTELIMSEAIDNNNDSNFSTNLVDELECLYAEYNINEDGTWSSEGNSLDVSYDSQNQIIFDCSTINHKSGVWILESDKLNMGNNEIWTFQGDKITLEINNDLGFRQTTYIKK